MPWAVIIIITYIWSEQFISFNLSIPLYLPLNNQFQGKFYIIFFSYYLVVGIFHRPTRILPMRPFETSWAFQISKLIGKFRRRNSPVKLPPLREYVHDHEDPLGIVPVLPVYNFFYFFFQIYFRCFLSVQNSKFVFFRNVKCRLVRRCSFFSGF